MGQQSFAEVLENKILDTQQRPIIQAWGESPTANHWNHFDWEFQSSKICPIKRHPYGPPKPHHLNSQQKEAFNFFIKLGAMNFSMGFCLKDLKRNFRMLAKTTHPDQALPGQNCENFYKLRMAYECLLQVFIKKNH